MVTHSNLRWQLLIGLLTGLTAACSNTGQQTAPLGDAAAGGSSNLQPTSGGTSPAPDAGGEVASTPHNSTSAPQGTANVAPNVGTGGTATTDDTAHSPTGPGDTPTVDDSPTGGTRGAGGATSEPPAAGGVAGDAPRGGNGGEQTMDDPMAGDNERERHFADWPASADPANVGRTLAELFDSQAVETKHYKEACAWYGSLAIAGLIEDQALIDSLTAKYSPFVATYGELLAGNGHVDENVFGIVPLEIALHDADPSYLQEGEALAAHQMTHIEQQIRFAIDDMFMITALQVQAYRASGNVAYLELAASTMVRYLEQLQQGDGLFFHHQDFHHKWGRGNGWFAVGMAEVLRELPEGPGDYAAIRTGYENMMVGLASYQITSGDGAGLWKQIVDSDDPRNWPETSGSAMFAYALVTGVRLGLLDVDTYGPIARAAWIALTNELTPTGQLQDVSNWAYKPESHPESGTRYVGDEENYYFEREPLTGDNHGQAPMLWTAAALLR